MDQPWNADPVHVTETGYLKQGNCGQGPAEQQWRKVQKCQPHKAGMWSLPAYSKQLQHLMGTMAIRWPSGPLNLPRFRPFRTGQTGHGPKSIELKVSTSLQ